MQAFPRATQANWEVFLGHLGGAPPRVVCDNHSGLTNAVRAAFPQTDVYLCEWHLRFALDRLLKKLKTDEPAHRTDFEQLRQRLDSAFVGASFWRPFVRDAHQVGSNRLSNWLNSTGRIVQEQFRRRGLSTHHPADMPLTTSPMDAFSIPSATSSIHAATR